MWSHRDIAVVPWISQRHPNSGGNLDGPLNNSTTANHATNPRRPTRSNSNKILKLLQARQRVGGGSTHSQSRVGRLTEGVVVSTDSLAGAGAWNSRRMQNTILCIGPGTPAACVLPSSLNLMESSASDSSGSEDIDDEEDEDDEDEVDDDEEDEEVEEEEEDVADSEEEDVDLDEEDLEEDDLEVDEEGKEEEDEELHDDDMIDNTREEVRNSSGEDDGTVMADEVTDNDGEFATTAGAAAGATVATTPIATAMATTKLDSTSKREPLIHNHDDDDLAGNNDDRDSKRKREIKRALFGKNTEESNDDVDDAIDAVAFGTGSQEPSEGGENNNQDESLEPIGSRARRRSRWTRQSHHEEEDSDVADNDPDNDMNDVVNDHDHDHDDDEEYDLLYEEQQEVERAEQYIESLRNRIRHHNRRRRRRRERQQQARNAAARASSDSSNSGQEMEREVTRSMKHGGCINTACWLDSNWRISTVSHEDAFSVWDYYCNDGDGFTTASSYSSNNTSRLALDDNGSGPFSSPRRRQQTPQYGTFVTPTSSNEFPSQLLTSGDDHLVKFWDVAQSMGSISPLPGGPATVTPFSSDAEWKPTSELVSSWRDHAEIVRGDGRKTQLPGIVHPLLTLTTGHRGNIFHVSPIPHRPGKIATCAADGYLRLIDVELQSTSTSSPAVNRARSNSSSSASNVGDASTVVISPEYQNENGESEASFRYHQSLMCFSHEFINTNVGLVCSERGLLHFDLRLPARSQHRGSLVEELSRTCKACKVWNAYGAMGEGNGEDQDLESAYVFAGGSGCDVVLYDLRMVGNYSCQAVQRFRPRPLRGKSSSVSVSGIDVSKDKRELLISYENDQIYTFPIFPNALSAAGPSLADMESSNAEEGDITSSGINRPVPELAAYGGHLNRLTFLKMAKYAGPRDEYICTGSDSGHAWIYDKKTGAVVSFLKADNSTCNGIVPHPTLPYFITYGIDSTAKLWRASNPVDHEVDDTDLGRFAYSQKDKYQKSFIVDLWKSALRRKAIDLDDENQSFFPDEIPTVEEATEESFFGGLGLLFVRARFGSMQPYIGNDLKKLGLSLTQNYFACARACSTGDEEPVRSGLLGLKRRVSLIKLHHQADSLGLALNEQVPWIMGPKSHLLLQNELDRSGDAVNAMVSYGALADSIPDRPSDWMPYDELLSNPPQVGGMMFNRKDYDKFYLDLYSDHSVIPVDRANNAGAPIDDDIKMIQSTHHAGSTTNVSIEVPPSSYVTNVANTDGKEKEDDSSGNNYNSNVAWDILYQTVLLLKEAGNEAMRFSLYPLAAKRYDKAINYCSVAYLEFQVGNCEFLAEHQVAISDNGGYECRWSPLFKLLIQVRLNLSMCLLKEDMKDVKSAIAQANTSIKELKPFSMKKGVVMTGKKLDKERPNEPESTFVEAKSLEAKAYFRLGSAQMILGDFDDAVKSLLKSIKAAGDDAPDKTVLRKLSEARKGCQQKKERQKRKFKLMFGASSGNNSDDDDCSSSGIGAGNESDCGNASVGIED